MGRDLRSILDAVLDGIVLMTPKFEIEHLNAEACRILETSVEHARGQRLGDLIGVDSAVPGLVAEVASSGRPRVIDEMRLPRRFGPEIEIDVAISPIGDAEGGFLVSLRDHTIRNTLRDVVSQRERLDSYGQIAAGIAHEVKNPLGGIRGAAELLGQRSDNEKQKNIADLIVREVDRISALVEELMVFARGEDLDLAPTNLHRVLDGVLELLALDPLGVDAEFERLYDPSIPELPADADRLTQVFLNLTRNGLQSMDHVPRRLQIVTRVSLDHRVSNREGRLVPTACVTIKDEGRGIPAENLEHLATPFYTTRAQGTGLGLAVSRHWVARHGGQMRVESQPGEGTTVHTLLPLVDVFSAAESHGEEAR